METIRTDPHDTISGDDYVDTVALLQEEIARLEAEIRLRDEAGQSSDPRPDDSARVVASEGRLAELTALLAERDETVGLLWEQLRIQEEVQAARAAEWDQLHRWVEELEARIGSEATPASDPGEDRRQAEALQDQLEGRRRAWESERRHLEEEIATLRGRLDAASVPGGHPDHAALDGENRRLREECRRLAAFEPAASEAETLRAALHEVRGELERSQRRAAQAEDELQRRCREHEAELAALRTRQAGDRAAPDGELSPNDRIRALRDHLREIHEREDLERKEKQLSYRLSRLWNRSSTGR